MVPTRAEFGAGFEMLVAAIGVARVAVLAKMMEVVVTLEHAVVLDDPVVLFANVGA